MSIGVVFPFSLATGSLGYVASSDDVVTALISNVKSLLTTNWGERVMQPDLGCNLREFLFEPLTQALRAPIADRIRSQLKRWLPFLELKSLTLKFSADDLSVPNNGMLISMEIFIPPSTVVPINQLLVQ